MAAGWKVRDEALLACHSAASTLPKFRLCAEIVFHVTSLGGLGLLDEALATIVWSGHLWFDAGALAARMRETVKS